MSSSDSSACGCSTENRRGFVTNVIALLIGAAAYLPPAVIGAVAFLRAPFRRKSRTGQAFRLTSLDSLAIGDPPKNFPVVADRDDAWNRFPNEPIGSVLLRRTGEAEVEALNVVCPHAGCSVQYMTRGDKLYCPCHQASFSLTGLRLDEVSPCPRDLDTLEVEITDGEVWVQIQNFRTGSTKKVPQA